MNYSANWKDLVSRFGYGFVDDIEQYKNIVKVRAYADMQPRTIGGLGKFRENSDNNDKLDSLFNELAEKLYSFVIQEPEKSEQDFDDWHKKQGEWFTSEFNRITNGKSVDAIAFGKAQKIINVSFKYIYCLKDANYYAAKFEHCHMILDRYTYSGDYGIDAFYKNEVVPWHNKNHSSNKIYESKLTRWSNLEYSEYYEIQKNIRDFLNSTKEYVDNRGKPLTPFQAEFHIFSRYNS